ncbi:hypothetical protein Ae263Ps1_4343c [Pseudonocardia sp. Ae263_Ps1]|nr:hypothetical protein Ae263Ps1_4343c [Pseudonocardia sp. Ae263_Ps1]OLL92682.1 hypothetical protein Ae356Ps1_2579 [Pseudonocardia sp. Ae356_Ps1]
MQARMLPVRAGPNQTRRPGSGTDLRQRRDP